MERNQAFFTEFFEADNKIFQRINKSKQIELKLNDFTHLNIDQAEQIAIRLYKEDYAISFDLDSQKNPLIRACLFKLSENIHFFYVIIHHIIFDGRSHFIFFDQLWKAYKQFLILEDQDIKWQNQPTYIDFVLYEQNFLKNNLKDFDYWQKNLEDFDFIEPCTIPGDKLRPTLFSSKGNRQTIFIPSSILEKMNNISTGTMFQKFLAVCYSLIYFYSGRTDLLVGSPIESRYRNEFKNLIGFFVNMIPLRIKLEPNDTFTVFVNKISQVTLNALDHSKTPFDELVGRLPVKRNASVTPVFSVSVCYHNSEREFEYSQPSELNVERVLPHNDSAKWDLYFDFLPEITASNERVVRFTLEYYSDYYSDLFVEKIMKTFMFILERVSENPLIEICSLLDSYDLDEMSIVHGKFSPLAPFSLVNLLVDKCNQQGSKEAVICNNSTNNDKSK